MLDSGSPIIKRPQIQLWNWIADYYLATVGEVMKAALLTNLKVESETFVELGCLTSKKIHIPGCRNAKW